jgi:hypothetical protein
VSVFLWNKTTNIFSYDVLTVACGGVDRLIIFSANLDSVSSLQRWMRVREQVQATPTGVEGRIWG